MEAVLQQADAGVSDRSEGRPSIAVLEARRNGIGELLASATSLVIATDCSSLQLGPGAVNCVALNGVRSATSGMMSFALIDDRIGAVVIVDEELPPAVQEDICILELAVLENACAPSFLWLSIDGALRGTATQPGSDRLLAANSVSYKVRLEALGRAE